jgi:hypothetical protein
VGFLSKMTDNFFATNNSGESIFCPWGKAANGYTLRDKRHEEKLRKILSVLNVSFISLLFLLGVTIGWAFGLILLPFYYLALFLIVHIYTKELKKVGPLSGGRLFWQVYFWLIAAIIVLSYVSKGPIGTWKFVDLAMSSGSLAALFLYAYRKKLFAPLFWKVYFVVFIVWDLSYNLIIEPKAKGEAFQATTLLGFLFIAPIYVALYLYAFKYLNTDNNQES